MMKTIQLLLFVLFISVSFASGTHPGIHSGANMIETATLQRHTATPLLSLEAAKPRLNLEPKIRIRRDKPRRTVETFSLISFITGLASIFLPNLIIYSSMLGLAIALASIISLTALVFGIIGFVRVSQNKEEYMGRGFAIAGFVLGLLGMLIWTVAFLAWWFSW